MDRAGKSIVLIGMMGAGKSSVGRCLQQRTGLARFETDQLIAAKFQLAIPEIFGKHGEEKFRDTETAALRELARVQSAIIVTGGGIVQRDENNDLLKRLGVVVWLDGNEETLFERASRRGNRPLLQTENPRGRFAELLQARAQLYAKAADIRVDTTNLTHNEVADLVLSEIENHSAVAK